MKVTINIDCTPQEARAFFGLPDVTALNKAMMDEAESQMRRNMANMSPEAMMKLWLPAGMQGLEQFQKMFWSQVGKGFGATGSSGGERPKPGSGGEAPKPSASEGARRGAEDRQGGEDKAGDNEA
jgi:hypothetical protein